MKKIGLIDVDGHNFPNYALMKISAYHKSLGDSVEWADPLFGIHYDIIYKSKIFSFSEDIPYFFNADNIICGGTGYDIKSTLPPHIENFKQLDYSIYPQYNFSLQFFSRGCIRHCPFCIVHDKEGYIHPVQPLNLNPNGKWIEVLDNNFFANPQWKSAIQYLIDANQKVNLHGVDIRIMNQEQASYLDKLKLKQNIHIAWDLPQIDLTQKLIEVTKYLNPNKLHCYVLVGFNSTPQQDLYRLRTLKKLKIMPFVQPYRNPNSKSSTPTQYQKDIARWANRTQIFKSCDFLDFSPRKNFSCKQYFS